MMATLPTLLQPKTLPIKADATPQLTRQERAEADLTKAEAGIGETRKKELEQDIRQAEIKSEMDVTKAREGARITREERKAIEESEPYKRSQAVATELMNQRFQPTQRSAQENAAIFSLINVLGLYIGRGGKQTSQQALAAMNGMLEGKQAGDAQRFREEKIKFDTNLRALNQTYQTLNTELKRISDLAARDKQAAAQELDVLLAQKGADFLKANIAKVGLEKTRIDLENAAKASRRIIEREAEADRRAAEKEAQLRFQRQTQVILKGMQAPAKSQIFQSPDGRMFRFDEAQDKFVPVELPSGVTSLTKPGAKAGQNALTFASRVFGNVQNAANDFANIVNLPATAETPVFSGLLNTERRTALGSLESLAARKITKTENRAFQQVSDQLGSALAGMEAQGLASGVTKAKIDAFNSLRPAQGDNAINMALYIARIKQEIQTGISVHEEMPGATDGQKEKTKAILAKMNQVVPFDVDDVLQVMRRKKQTLGDKMEKLIKQKPIAPSLQFEGTPAADQAEDATERYTDPEKERRYQEWLARQPK